MSAKKRRKKQDNIIAMIKGKRGLSVEIATACGIERAAVYQWKRVPVNRVNAVAKVIGMKPKQIRPDIFG